MPDHPDWPPSVRAAMASPALERKGWQKSLGPSLIGLFLWIGFFDQIPRETVGRSGLAWPVLGSAVGGILGYLLLFRVPTLWTYRTGRPLAVVFTSTFGIRGATMVPGWLIIAIQVVWIAIATHYASTLTLRGLELLGLLDPSYHHNIVVGRVQFPSGLFMVTAFFFGLAATMAGRYLVRVITALMAVYPIIIAVLLGITAALAIKGLPDYRVLLAGVRGGSAAGIIVALIAAQMVFAFAAAGALSAAELGVVAQSERDVKLGGWVGLAGGSIVVATLSIMTVAGVFIRYGIAVPVNRETSLSLTFVHGVETVIGGRTAGAMLLAFGLAGLAPACFSSYIFTAQAYEAFPSVARTKWTILGFLTAWLLVIFGQVDHLYPVLGFVGALLAPVLGAMAADAYKAGGKWPGARVGVNPPGYFAWLAGAIVGVAPFAAPDTAFARLQPASLIAFCAAFVTYLIAAAFVRETAIDPSIMPVTHESE